MEQQLEKFSSRELSLFLTRLTSCTMGRRKSKRKPPPKKKLTGDLDSQFTCPFCNHEKSLRLVQGRGGL
ncbi:Transcription elongation factor 1 [Liparis tanakae]|uniref:Transcription elongation factor 1 n=1 Tax=Liparis tanakae TaxID=230148 RepID=A0A4Z2J0D1_9TELE|nr:Transcription elongation factor 1 [Liparis tanakae]